MLKSIKYLGMAVAILAIGSLVIGLLNCDNITNYDLGFASGKLMLFIFGFGLFKFAKNKEGLKDD